MRDRTALSLTLREWQYYLAMFLYDVLCEFDRLEQQAAQGEDYQLLPAAFALALDMGSQGGPPPTEYTERLRRSSGFQLFTLGHKASR